MEINLIQSNALILGEVTLTRVFWHIYSNVATICHHRYLTACSSAQSENYVEIMRKTKTAIEDGNITTSNELAAFVVDLILEGEVDVTEDPAVSDA